MKHIPISLETNERNYYDKINQYTKKTKENRASPNTKMNEKKNNKHSQKEQKYIISLLERRQKNSFHSMQHCVVVENVYYTQSNKQSIF